MRTFGHSIESKTQGNKDQLYYPEQYTSRQPRDLVRSCLHIDPTRGYSMVKQLLKENFGDEIRLSTAYIERGMNWPNIRTEDNRALQKYVLYLRG